MVRGAAVCAWPVALIGRGAGARPNFVESGLSVSQHRASLRVADVVRKSARALRPVRCTKSDLPANRGEFGARLSLCTPRATADTADRWLTGLRRRWGL